MFNNPIVLPILNWLQASWLGEITRDVVWLFAFFETIHFIGLCILMGAMLLVDLRLLGVLRLGSIRSVLSFTHVAIFGFALNVISGLGFLASAPNVYIDNPIFQAKIILIIVAGLNVLWFEVVERRKILALVEGVDTGADTKLVAGLSLVLWTVIIVLGRFLPTMSAT
jgi:hypothetical protein